MQISTTRFSRLAVLASNIYTTSEQFLMWVSVQWMRWQVSSGHTCQSGSSGSSAPGPTHWTIEVTHEAGSLGCCTTDIINPRRACAAGVTVVGLCVRLCCLSVCLSTTILALQATRRLMSDTNSFSATRAWKTMWRFCWNDCVREIWPICIISTGLPRPGLARSAYRGRRGYVSKSSAALNPLTITQLACER